LRLGWINGRQETFDFAAVDRLVSAGVQLSGLERSPPDGQLSFGIATGGLSLEHRRYLAAGGYGIALCDGSLHYVREQVLEVYWHLQRV
jgi:high affinity Mn2+ porin